MNITSMSNLEVYKTLKGHDYKWKKPFGWVELNDCHMSQNVDIPKAADSAKVQEMKVGNAMSEIITRDTFEYSDKFVFSEVTEEDKQRSEDILRRACDIDFNDKEVIDHIVTETNMELLSLSHGGELTKEHIASYFGNMAKRLDEAYSDGKFTEEEFDYLNKGIAEQMEHYTVCAERNKARDTIAVKLINLPPNNPIRAVIRTMTSEQYMNYMDSEIDKYVARYYKIDRTALLNLFNSVRYGK